MKKKRIFNNCIRIEELVKLGKNDDNISYALSFDLYDNKYSFVMILISLEMWTIEKGNSTIT